MRLSELLASADSRAHRHADCPWAADGDTDYRLVELIAHSDDAAVALAKVDDEHDAIVKVMASRQEYDMAINFQTAMHDERLCPHFVRVYELMRLATADGAPDTLHAWLGVAAPVSGGARYLYVVVEEYGVLQSLPTLAAGLFANAASIARQMAYSAEAMLRAGLQHRDVSVNNAVFRMAAPTRSRVLGDDDYTVRAGAPELVWIDYDRATASSLSGSEDVLTTAVYRAPELFFPSGGIGVHTRHTDWWSMAMALFDTALFSRSLVARNNMTPLARVPDVAACFGAHNAHETYQRMIALCAERGGNERATVPVVRGTWRCAMHVYPLVHAMRELLGDSPTQEYYSGCEREILRSVVVLWELMVLMGFPPDDVVDQWRTPLVRVLRRHETLLRADFGAGGWLGTDDAALSAVFGADNAAVAIVRGVLRWRPAERTTPLEALRLAGATDRVGSGEQQPPPDYALHDAGRAPTVRCADVWSRLRRDGSAQRNACPRIE